MQMKLNPVIEAKLMECKCVNRWPTTPVSRDIQNENIAGTVVLLLSVDSGAGTVKLIGKFLRVNGNQTSLESNVQHA